MRRSGALNDCALRFLTALELWDVRVGVFQRRTMGRRAGGRLTTEIGEIRRATALLAIAASEMSVPADHDLAVATLRGLLVRLRETGALTALEIVAVVNEVADTVPPPLRK